MDPKTTTPSLDDTFAAFFGGMDEIEAEVREMDISDAATAERHPAKSAADTTEEAARNR